MSLYFKSYEWSKLLVSKEITELRWWASKKKLTIYHLEVDEGKLTAKAHF